ncbi:hypothetical protein [Streptomyces sp. NPDC048623]|uniref:hypothetical protein n=1 Tax=Streptomyces sp. NPDC048623 TaxID=3155761 RepID=UPI00343C55AF
MSEETWAVLTDRDTVLLLSAVSVYLGGVIGFARRLPRVLMRNQGWRADTGEDSLPSAVTLTALIVLWPAAVVYVLFKVSARRRR